MVLCGSTNAADNWSTGASLIVKCVDGKSDKGCQHFTGFVSRRVGDENLCARNSFKTENSKLDKLPLHLINTTKLLQNKNIHGHF
jgi:hypothetical protein